MTAAELRRMLELCQRRWPDVRCTFGQIAFWSAQLGRDDLRVLVLDGAWGYVDRGELEYDGDGEQLDEIIAWARPERVMMPLRDAELLARHGLRHDPDGDWFKLNARGLDEIEEPHLPDGYRLTTMAEYTDTEARSAAHRSAFAPRSRFTDEVYALVRAGWPYRADLDCVCVAPDGSVASYAIAWLDDANGVGELEPVGTHSEHRRLGLARATNLFALRRLRDAGAHTALVACRGDDRYPAPRELYASVGFEESDRKVSFTRS